MATLNSHLTGYSTWCPQGYSAFWVADIFGEVFAASVQDRFLNLRQGSKTLLYTIWGFWENSVKHFSSHKCTYQELCLILMGMIELCYH